MHEWVGHRPFEEVLAAARAGDDAAFAQLWRWLHVPLSRWLSVVAPGDLDDVESEVWLSIARNLHRFRGDDDDFRGWVFTIARRRAIDWGRRRRRLPTLHDLEGVDVIAELDEPDHGDVEGALAMLRHLTADQREVLALRVIVGMSVPETAAIVRRSDGAVRVLCHRGLRALERQLEAETAADEVAS
jgi:RNA polymerase sigma-70 factor (ECF subfamily)